MEQLIRKLRFKRAQSIFFAAQHTHLIVQLIQQTQKQLSVEFRPTTSQHSSVFLGSLASDSLLALVVPADRVSIFIFGLDPRCHTSLCSALRDCCHAYAVGMSSLFRDSPVFLTK